MLMQMIHASNLFFNVIFNSAHNGLIQCVTIHELDEKKKPAKRGQNVRRVARTVNKTRGSTRLFLQP
jgi:hypothetical protein